MTLCSNDTSLTLFKKGDYQIDYTVTEPIVLKVT